MGTLGYSFMINLSTITTANLFEVISFSQPSWNLTKNVLFWETPFTTPVNSLLIILENHSLNSSSNSPTFTFTTVPTRILSPLPLDLYYMWGVILIIIIKGRSINGELRLFLDAVLLDSFERLVAF